MVIGTDGRPVYPQASILPQVEALVRENVGEYHRGTVDIQGETVGYEIYSIDARSTQQREQDVERGRPDGNIMVVVPGHGQSIRGPKKLLATTALMSRSKIAWCIDPIPAEGGDRTEGQVIARVVRDRASAAFPAVEEPVAATLVGWSHGGAEALLAADFAPDLFPQFLGLCPTGLVDRHPLGLVHSFFLESSRIIGTSLRERDWTCLKDTLRLGSNAGAGLVRDLWRSRSLRRLTEDVGWASRKVSSKHLSYSGEVVLLFGASDTVVRWRDAFPECAQPQQMCETLAEFQQDNFPSARRVEVEVIEGAHIAPEVDAVSFVRPGLGLLGQLDE